MRAVWMLDENNIYVCATPGEVFVTSNGGTSWASDYPQDFDPAFYKVKFTSNGTGFVCGSSASGGTILRKLPSPIGVNEIELSNLAIYPNPANDQLNIKIPQNELPVRFELMDLLGNRVNSQQIDQPITNVEIVINEWTKLIIPPPRTAS